MTAATWKRNPGRQPTVDDDLRNRFLKAVAQGMRLGEAAQRVGVSPNFARRQERTNPSFATALQDAKAHGKKLREDQIEHSEAHYIKQKCRHPKCVAAASKARAGRRQKARETGGEVVDLPPPLEPAPVFPLLRAS